MFPKIKKPPMSGVRADGFVAWPHQHQYSIIYDLQVNKRQKVLLAFNLCLF